LNPKIVIENQKMFLKKIAAPKAISKV
jgi:hypothetical protein